MVMPLLPNMQFYTSPSRMFHALPSKPLKVTVSHPTQKNPPVIKNGDSMTSPFRLNSMDIPARRIHPNVRILFSTYAESLDPVKNLILSHSPRRENESDEGYDRRIRSQYVDRCRFILPAAANANVGMTANARVLEMVIRKMLSHPLAEVRQIGETMKEVAKAETPTLVKYADACLILLRLLEIALTLAPP
jgi:thymidylate synthase ThyX